MAKHVPPPTGEPLESVSPELAMQEAQRIATLQRLRGLRKEARDEIDRLLNFLDASDLDPDLEETADAEPSLGWTNPGPSQCSNCGGIEDLEHDDCDDEPSLGSGAAAVYSTQSHWSQLGGGSDDREEDAGDSCEEENEHCDGHADSEPSLGWPEGMAQGQGRWGGTDDREVSAEPSAACVEIARKRHNHTSICNVAPVNGEWWKIEKVD